MLTAWFVWGVGGCHSGTHDASESSSEPIQEIAWGLSKSEALQEELCSAAEAFSASIDFSDRELEAPPDVSERVLCGLPRSSSEPKSYKVHGRIIGFAFTRAGKITSQCEYTPPVGPAIGSVAGANFFSCSSLHDTSNTAWPGDVESTISLDLEDFSDSGGIIRTEELNSELARVSERSTVSLTVPPGVYVTQEAIRINGSIILDGAGMGLSRIIGAGLEMRSILEVGPASKEELELSVTAMSGGKVLHVGGLPNNKWQDSCSRIVIRDAAQIWPWDARDYVFYGEIADAAWSHQGFIVLSEALRDTYSPGSQISFTCPSSVAIRNISFEFANPVLGTKALSISGADPVIVTNVEIEKSGRVGVWIAESANVLVSHSDLRNGFPLNCDTCYGVQTYGAQDVLIHDNSIVGFRRAIDISGTIPSRRVMVRNNFVLAESDTVRAASGIGTHGSAEGVIFEDNDVFGGIVSILVRGDDVLVSNNRLLDAEYSSIYLDSGGSHYLNGNQLGGNRVSGRPTIRGVEFHVTSGHVFSRITNNVVSASVGVRLAETPGQIEIAGNTMAIEGVAVQLDEGVVLDDNDMVEFEW